MKKNIYCPDWLAGEMDGVLSDDESVSGLWTWAAIIRRKLGRRLPDPDKAAEALSGLPSSR